MKVDYEGEQGTTSGLNRVKTGDFVGNVISEQAYFH